MTLESNYHVHFLYFFILQSATIEFKNPSQYLSPFTLTIMKGLTKNPSLRAIISQTMDFLKESFVQASLAMASLCGLNAGHIWSNYLTRKQLSVILKGEVFQLLNLLNSVALPLHLKTALAHTVSEGLEGYEGIRCVVVQQLQQLPRSLVCQRI